MTNQRVFYFPNDLHARPNARRWWPKAIAVFAVVGGLYGAAVGSALAAVPGAAEIIEIAAGVLAVFLGIPGTRIGSLIGIFARSRFARVAIGVLAAFAGAVLGGMLAMMILLAFGAFFGAVGGWIVTTGIIALRHGGLRRFFFGMAGAVVGMFLGAILWAVNLNQAAALVGAAWGFGIGVVVGPLLFLTAIGTMNSLAHTHIRERMERRRDVVDATFHDGEQGGRSSSALTQEKGDHDEEA